MVQFNISSPFEQQPPVADPDSLARMKALIDQIAAPANIRKPKERSVTKVAAMRAL